MKKKFIVACALALAASVGLAASPKVQASSSAKVYFKQYKKTKNYKNGLKAKYSYNLPQLKGKSKAIKKINKDLLKNYMSTVNTSSKELFAMAKDSSKGVNSPYGFIMKNCTYLDITKPSVSYNKNGIISFKVYRNYWDGYYVGNMERVYGQSIFGWTYSLRSGKRLYHITDVAKGNKASVQKKLNAGVKKYFGAKKGEWISLYFYLKNGKVYLYPAPKSLTQLYDYAHRNPPIRYNSYFTIESRYK